MCYCFDGSKIPSMSLRMKYRYNYDYVWLIYGENRRCSISPLLKSLHWLRVEERITYKLCLTVYKALNGKAPECISELCTLDLEERRALRSRAHSTNKLVEPNRANKSNFFERAFSVAGPVTWNRLPLNVRQNQTESSFRNALKTALFPRSHPRPWYGLCEQ